MHKIIHSFEIDTSWLLSLLKLLILFRWMKQFSKRLLKALTMWIKEEILVICKRLFKSRKKCDYFNYLLNKHKMFHLFGLCLQRFVEKIWTTHPPVIAFMVRGVMPLKCIFSIFPLAWLFEFMVYLQICQWISKQVFYSTEILYFVLIPRYGCFRTAYVSRSIDLNLYPSEIPIRALESRMFQKNLSNLRSCQRHFLKRLHGQLTPSKNQKWMLNPCINDFRETSSWWFYQ